MWWWFGWSSLLCCSRNCSASSIVPLFIIISSSWPILDSCVLTSIAFLRIPVSLHTQSDDESSGSSGSIGFPLSKMVDMFEPNSVASQHLEQEHQKFLVMLDGHALQWYPRGRGCTWSRGVPPLRCF